MSNHLARTKMSDTELLAEGWIRNANGGLTRLSAITAPKPKKTLGVISVIRGVLSGAAPEGIQEVRLRTCKSCQELNSKGERLFRELDGKIYCGTPRLTDIYRDESQEGCGCDLEFKTSLSDTCCPLGKWIKFSSSKSGGCGCNKSSPSPSTSRARHQLENEHRHSEPPSQKYLQ